MDDRSTMDVLRGSRILAFSVGLITIAAGAVLLFWPDRTIVVVARLAGALIAVVGIAEAVEAVTSHRKGSYWGLLLFRGLLNIAVGAILVFWPDITVTVLVWLFGLDLVFVGIIGLVASRQVPKELGRSGLVLRSALGIVLGLLIVVWPDVTLWIITIIVAVQLIVLGIILLYSGYELSKVDPEALTA